MKKNKVLNAYIISGNGSRQLLNLLSYNDPTDLTDNDFVRWDVPNAVLRPTPQDGLLEYDGTHLYFTIGTTRKTVTLA